MNKAIKIITIVFLITLSGVGCSQRLYPAEMAGIFWRAIQTNNVGKLRWSITRASLNENDLMGNILDIGEVSLGKTVIDGSNAWVDTTVEIKAENSFKAPLKTVLRQEKGLWKVDYTATVASISRHSEMARVIGRMHELGDQIAGQFDGVIDELQKSIPEVQRELKKLEEHIKSQIPELKERLEDFAKELDKALKIPPEQKQQPIKI
ncbi:MAG: hypothetical protein ACE5GZ_13345 [Gammaproteobacteria bacterium]